MGSMLTVDFDFFFPRPAEGTTESMLYDWGHAESMLYITMLWNTRAAAFINNDVELPQLTDDWRGWWRQFRFAADTQLFVGESHSYAVDPQIADRVDDQVWLFDAHHDCGYAADKAAEAINSGRWSCEDWLLYYYYSLGHDNAHMRYPRHRINAFDEEPAPYGQLLDRDFYDPVQPDHFPVFDTIYVCRSGAWVPPWCDEDFDTWVADTGLEPTWIGERIDRQWDMDTARAEAAAWKEAMEQFKIRKASQ